MDFWKPRHWCWTAFLWILIQLPFLPGPFRIDDPYHLEAAEQMRREPGDPYGFQINWEGTPRSAFITYASPPLVPAWLALWTSVFPENEVSLHIAMLPFSLAAILAFGLLAQSFEVRPWVAIGLLVCSPAFFLASQVLMPDLPMLCLFLVAVTATRLYQLRQNSLAALVACLAGFCCPLAKYNGAVLVPVLICMEVSRRIGLHALNNKGLDANAKRRGILWDGGTQAMIAIISAPIMSLLCWGSYTWAKYGAVHFMKMSTFQRGQAHSLEPAMLTAGILGAVGIGVVPLTLLGFLLRLKRAPRWLTVLAVGSAIGAMGLAALMRYGLVSTLLFALSVYVAIYLLALAICVIWQHAGTEDLGLLSLAVWILVGVGFQYGLMFSAVRYVLFLSPPAILLALRLSAWVPRDRRLALTLGANLLFVGALGFADARQAKVYPSFVAEQIRPRLKQSDGRFFFDGHWGFQYYAGRMSGTPIDELNLPDLRAGDLVVVAKTPWPKLKHPPPAPGFVVETTQVSVPASGFVRTVSCEAGANFYASVLADCERPTWLPFGFSSKPAENFVLYRVIKPSSVER